MMEGTLKFLLSEKKEYILLKSDEKSIIQPSMCSQFQRMVENEEQHLMDNKKLTHPVNMWVGLEAIQKFVSENTLGGISDIKDMMGTVNPLKPGEYMVTCKKAPPNQMSCHVDGAKVGDAIGIGGVVRDEHGQFVMAFYEYCPDLKDQDKGEVRAMKRATTLLKDGGVIYSDFKIGLSKIKSQKKRATYDENIVELRNLIGKFQFEFTESTANRMADTLAKKAAKKKLLGMQTIVKGEEEEEEWMIQRLGMDALGYLYKHKVHTKEVRGGDD